MHGRWRVAVVLGVALVAGCAGGRADTGGVAAAQQAEPQAGQASYRLYVANESSDVVSRVVFVPGEGARVEQRIPVGIMPADVDGPHGVTVSADGGYWYVTLGHGMPFGTVWKYEAGRETPVGRAQLGLFPASMSITADGEFLFVSNFNLHGDPVPSGVSVVYTPGMLEVARPTTCVMPHGSRINSAGTKHYSVCMHSDQLVEIDTRTFEVTGRFSLVPGREGALALDDTGEHGHGGHGDMSHGGGGAGLTETVCSPTWVQPGRGSREDLVYVACNRRGEVVEVDTRTWEVTRRFTTGKGPYNLEVSQDGRTLVTTLKGDQGVAIHDLERGIEVARVATSQPITHGVVLSADGRYAFVSNEAIGSVRGTLDVIDLMRRERVATVELEHQAAGLDLMPGR